MKKTKVLLVFLLVLIFIVEGFYLIKQNTEKMDKNPTTIALTMNDVHSNVSISSRIKGSWTNNDEKNKFAAEYDLVLSNNSKLELRDWTLKIALPKTYHFEQIWNGDYEIDEAGYLVITPVNYNLVIKAESSIPIGFIVYTPAQLGFEDISITCHFVHDYTDSIMYKILYVLSIIWGLGMLVFIAVVIQHRRYIRHRRIQEQIIAQTMNVVSSFVDAKDSYTNGHSKRVAYYTKELARRMKLSDDMINIYYYAAMLHDCGKILVPDHILNKEEKLTSDENVIMKNHTVCGGDALRSMTAIPEVRNGALYHHERYDGDGYPMKLKGKQIPKVARVICVADSFDAMYTDRCYRPALDKQTIIDELRKNRGTQFDPSIVGYMIDMINDGFVDSYDENVDKR